MAQYFPLMIDLEHVPILVVGGGATALKKIPILLPFHPHISVLAPTVLPELEQLEKEHKVVIVREELYRAEHFIQVLHPRLVILTEPEHESTAILFACCQRLGIEVNTPDCPQYCSFSFSSLIKKGKLTVAISTSGASPATAKKLREEIEQSIPDSIEKILDWLAELRPRLRERKELASTRFSVLYRALIDAAFEQNRPLNQEETEAILQTVGQIRSKNKKD